MAARMNSPGGRCTSRARPLRPARFVGDYRQLCPVVGVQLHQQEADVGLGRGPEVCSRSPIFALDQPTPPSTGRTSATVPTTRRRLLPRTSSAAAEDHEATPPVAETGRSIYLGQIAVHVNAQPGHDLPRRQTE
jgi:hypothetical protein